MPFVAVAALAADTFTFMLMVSRYGLATEVNPVVHLLGLQASIGLKLLMMMGITGLSWLVYVYSNRDVERRKRVMFIVLSVALVAGIVGAVSNVKVLVGA